MISISLSAASKRGISCVGLADLPIESIFPPGEVALIARVIANC